MLPALAIAGGSLLGSYLANRSAADRENDLNDQAFRQFVAINIPDPEKQKLALQRYVQQGELVPELQQAIQQQPSEFEKIMVDSGKRAAQSRALASLENIGLNGGLRLQDKAALQDVQIQNAMKDRGARAAIQDEMARKGQLGSGFALQAQLAGQQAAGDRAARAGLDIAASAQDRALRALEGAGELATKYRSQDFEEQAARARAQDAINEFNARNLQSVSNANVAARNRAAEMNLGERQRLSDANADLANKEQQYNRNLSQQYFQNQMDLAGAKAGQFGRQAEAAGRQGKQMADMWGRLGQAGVGMVTAADQNDYNREALDAYKERTSKMGAQSQEDAGPVKPKRYSWYDSFWG